MRTHIADGVQPLVPMMSRMSPLESLFHAWFFEVENLNSTSENAASFCAAPGKKCSRDIAEYENASRLKSGRTFDAITCPAPISKMRSPVLSGRLRAAVSRRGDGRTSDWKRPSP